MSRSTNIIIGITVGVLSALAAQVIHDSDLSLLTSFIPLAFYITGLWFGGFLMVRKI